MGRGLCKPTSVISQGDIYLLYDSLGQIIFELDKYEKNKNRAETRRHTILSLSDKDIKNVDVNEDILNIILKKSNLDKLHIAISKLKPQEQDLIYHLFFKAEPI